MYCKIDYKTNSTSKKANAPSPPQNHINIKYSNNANTTNGICSKNIMALFIFPPLPTANVENKM